MGALDQMVASLVTWFLGDDTTPGALERARGYVRAWAILGFLIPFITIVLGIIISRWGTSWAISWARGLMVLGILLGLPFAIIFLGGAVAIAGVLIQTIWPHTPESRAVRVVKAYGSFLVWLITVEELMVILGVFTPLGILLLGIVAGVVMALLTFSWDMAVGLGRRLLFSWHFVFLAWVFAVAIPSGVHLALWGVDVRSTLLSFGGAVEQWRVDKAQRLSVAQERKFASDELDQIIKDIEAASSDDKLRDAQKRLRDWKKQFGDKGVLPQAVEKYREWRDP